MIVSRGLELGGFKLKALMANESTSDLFHHCLLPLLIASCFVNPKHILPCLRYLESAFEVTIMLLMIILSRLLLLLMSNCNKMAVLRTSGRRELPHVHVI
jgi:hypothetical protein